MKKTIAILLALFLVIPLGMLFSSATETNVSMGKSYTKLGDGYAGNPNYLDTDNKELTDGIIASSQDNSIGAEWVGFHNSLKGGTETSGAAFYEVTIDLGEVMNNLSRFVTYSEHVWAFGIEAPTDVIISVSNDGASFTEVGNSTADVTNLVRSTEDTTDTTKLATSDVKLTLSLSQGVSGRYVKFHITAGKEKNFTFITELEVYQDPNATGGDTSSQTPVPEEAYSLISFDPTKWLSGAETNGETASAALSGDAIVVSGSISSWPYAYYNLEAPVTINPDDFELVYDFTVSGGKTNIILFCEGSTVEDNINYVNKLTHLMAEGGSEYRDEGSDDLKDGTYTGKIKLSDLDYTNVTIIEEGKITISAVKVFSVGGGVITINKFAVESIATVIPDTSETSSTTSSATSSVTSSAAYSQSTSSEPIITGDTGIIALFIIAAITLLGMSVIAIRKRR